LERKQSIVSLAHTLTVLHIVAMALCLRPQHSASTHRLQRFLTCAGKFVPFGIKRLLLGAKTPISLDACSSTRSDTLSVRTQHKNKQ
jgi:hypothetical protein